METFSFFLRVSFWGGACFFLLKAFISGESVIDFGLFLLMVLVAWGYSWFDNEVFGEVIHYSEPPPPPSIKPVDDYGHYVFQNTYYHQDTPQALVELLEELQQNRTCVRLFYGDPDTGEEERSATGYVNVSSGAVQIPLLAAADKPGGTPIPDQQIVKVVDAGTLQVLYMHPSYQPA